MERARRGGLFLLGFSVLSCAQIVRFNDYPEGAGGGGAGAGGAPSTSASTSANTSASTSASTSGAGGGCQCPPDPECATYSCVNNQCMLTNTQVGIPCSQQTKDDCKTRVCDGAG